MTNVETIYDHPLYYDILFGWDRSGEADFYERAFRHYGLAAGEPVLEVASGTGQVARRLARRGWPVTGLELRPAMAAFLEERAAAEGVRVPVIRGDMTDFETRTTFGAAYNPMSSFRLLETDAAAAAHLRAIAAVLRPGGVYVLDVDLLGDAAETPRTTDEAWEMERDAVRVRADDTGIFVVDGSDSLELPWGEEVHLRGYTAESFAAVVRPVEALDIEAWHPDVRSGEEENSRFVVATAATPPVSGRCMVVLRRHD